MNGPAANWSRFGLTALCVAGMAQAGQADQTLQHDGVVVSYDGIDLEHAKAIARTVASARTMASERFDFNMPQTIKVSVSVDPKEKVRLFNDGQDHFSLTIRDQRDLQRPEVSGIFHLYGLCHEVGHLAMYRSIRNRGWLTSAAAEGWAHYLGSRLVDGVYAREGGELWPDRYDYRADGMQRLNRQLSAVRNDDHQQGARLWQHLVQITGDRGVAPLFAAWGRIEVDPADPEEDVAGVLRSLSDDPRVEDWWQQASESLVVHRPRSTFTALTAQRGQLSGKTQELTHDDGQAAGKSSIAGGGHAVRFQVPDDSWYLTSVRIHGGRYGRSQPPREDFHIWLCDRQLNQIADFPIPYAKFARGASKWVTLEVKPTLVPQEFIICVGFNPTATKGVYVSHDDKANSDGTSMTGLPSGEPKLLEKGDWLIRATVTRRVGTQRAERQSTQKTRTWTDATGKFSVEAALVGVAGDTVRLKRKDGRVVTVPIKRLNAAAQQYLTSLKEGSAESPQDTAGSNGAAAVAVSQLAGKPQELKRDDGKAAGKKSFSRGHAVALEAPSKFAYVTAIRIHGSRYGTARPPREDFHVTLCDENYQHIADFKFPYSRFKRGTPQWLKLRVKPTRVPPKFVICVDFSPTQSKGVFVSHDAEGKSLVGLPGKPAGTFSGGDWLIRALVDQLRQ
jgi:hypothetical protein